MNHSDFLLCSAVGIVGAFLAARGRQPIRRLQRLCIVLRAVGFQAQECWDGAKARLGRWQECVARAEREA